jgi:acetylornithine deacetylase
MQTELRMIQIRLRPSPRLMVKRARNDLTQAEGPSNVDSIEILRKLIAFPTISRDRNLDLIGHVATLLEAHRIPFELIHDGEHRKANLFATVGLRGEGGHHAVRPHRRGANRRAAMDRAGVRDEREDRLYGRGAADMKGFVSCALAAVLRASRMELKTPLHLALSYDEKVGCLGVRSLIRMLYQIPLIRTHVPSLASRST